MRSEKRRPSRLFFMEEEVHACPSNPPAQRFERDAHGLCCDPAVHTATGQLFYTVYICAIVSDGLDGYLARRWRVQTACRAKLDSVADLLLIGCVLFVLWPQIAAIPLPVPCIVCVSALRLCAVLMARCRHGRWMSLHTMADKVAECAVAAVPFCLQCTCPAGAYAGIGLWTALCALEEVCIQCVGALPDPDVPSLWHHLCNAHGKSNS